MHIKSFKNFRNILVFETIQLFFNIYFCFTYHPYGFIAHPKERKNDECFSVSSEKFCRSKSCEKNSSETFVLLKKMLTNSYATIRYTVANEYFKTFSVNVIKFLN